MGLSVVSQCNVRDYFSLSTINKDCMAAHGLNMTIKDLREMARKTSPYMMLITGEDYVSGHRRKTNIYRYEDFKGVKHGQVSADPDSLDRDHDIARLEPTRACNKSEA